MFLDQSVVFSIFICKCEVVPVLSHHTMKADGGCGSKVYVLDHVMRQK